MPPQPADILLIVSDDDSVPRLGDNGAALLRGKGTLYEFGIQAPLIEWMVLERDYLPLPIAADPPDLR